MKALTLEGICEEDLPAFYTIEMNSETGKYRLWRGGERIGVTWEYIKSGSKIRISLDGKVFGVQV